MSKEYAYVELTFSKETKEHLTAIVDDLVNKEELYYSSVVSHIQGNVTKDAHVTVLYGLESSVANNTRLLNLLKTVNIKEVLLGELVLFEGYQGMYKILCIEVKDENKMLCNFAQQLLDFDHDKTVLHSEFKPHITLAYVKSDYKIPESYVLKERTLVVLEIKLSTTK